MKRRARVWHATLWSKPRQWQACIARCAHYCLKMTEVPMWLCFMTLATSLYPIFWSNILGALSTCSSRERAVRAGCCFPCSLNCSTVSTSIAKAVASLRWKTIAATTTASLYIAPVCLRNTSRAIFTFPRTSVATPFFLSRWHLAWLPVCQWSLPQWCRLLFSRLMATSLCHSL